MHLASIDAKAHAARREKLIRALGSQPALLASGNAPPRNYAANPYPFRAASHFLYFTGLAVADAFLLVDESGATLYLNEPTPADALWHGPSPSFQEIAQATGCNVASRAKLESVVRAKNVATLPAIDAATCRDQSAILGREIAPSVLSETDARLADAVITIRLVHDEAAQRDMREACATTARAHELGMRVTKPGLRELDVKAAMETPIFAAGGAPAYGSIVTVHGEVLHNNEYHHTLNYGDLLLADVGAEHAHGWASDVTRTWPVSGHFSPTQRAIYEVVLAAQHAAIQTVRPGARYRDVHRVACEVLMKGLVDLSIFKGDPRELVADGVHAIVFPHGTGHLLGMDVHDMEDLGDRAGYATGRTRSSQFGLSYLRLDRDLAPGMAVTIEPGFYQVPALLAHPELSKLVDGKLRRSELAKFADVRGIRIEDDVLVTQSGSDVLTSAIPKAPGAIEAAVRGKGSP